MPKTGQNTVVRLLGVNMYFDTDLGDGKDELVEHFDHYRRASRDFQAVNQWFGQYLLRRIDDTFRRGGRRGDWQPLAQATVLARRRRGTGTQILVESGELKNSFDYRAYRQSLRMFSRSRKFWWHQAGTATIPRRPIVVILAQDRAHYTRRARQHVGIE